MEKLKEIVQKTKESLTTRLLPLNSKITVLIPNPKHKKILYIAIGSLFGFMFLIIIFGLLLSPLRNTGQEGLLLKRPKIIIESPKPQVELNENKKQILKLETEIKELKFPESTLNIPVLEFNLSF